MPGGDFSEALIEALRGAREAGQSVAIAGSGSKAHLLGQADGQGASRLLGTVEHSGVVDYRPDELVLTVRSGTPLKEIRQILAREGQMLPFEPPEIRGLGTIGGAVASGLAGPGRPWRGGVRDSVLGVVMVNGLCQRLSFGGQVMKNVAGFDLSRLQAGAFGMFGLLLEVSLKVLPLPNREQTLILERTPEEALATVRAWAGEPWPITATAFEDGLLRARLSGAEAAVLDSARRIGGERQDGEAYWTGLRDMQAPFFRHQRVGCRRVPPATALAPRDALVEWSGARRWWALAETDDPGEGVLPFAPGYAARICSEAGGDPLLAAYQRRLKTAFDPENLFNPEICRADQPA